MKKLTETDIAMNINNLTYIDYLNRLKLIATSLFTWKGLDEVAGFGASRFLELVLYENPEFIPFCNKSSVFPEVVVTRFELLVPY